MKNIFDFFMPRTGRGGARHRQKELEWRIRKVMKLADEEEFCSALREEFDLDPSDAGYQAALSVWRDAQ